MMRALLIAAALLPAVAACTPMEEPMPQSPYQWERRQQRLAGEEAERVRLCQAARTEDARRRWCREGEPSQ